MVFWADTSTASTSGTIRLDTSTAGWTWDGTGHGWVTAVSPRPIIDPGEQEREQISRSEGRRQQRASGQRASALLESLMGPEAWATYQADGYLDIASVLNPGETYRIVPDQMINVRDAGGYHLRRLCIHTAERVPPHDDVIAKGLMALTDEATMLGIAIPH